MLVAESKGSDESQKQRLCSLALMMMTKCTGFLCRV